MDLKALARELHADERAELLAHLLALGAEDRRLRFEYSMSDDGVLIGHGGLKLQIIRECKKLDRMRRGQSLLNEFPI